MMDRATLLAVLIVAGCASSQDVGRPPPVQLVSTSRRVPMLADGRPDQPALTRAMAELAGNTALDADIAGLSPGAVDRARAALAGAGIDPDRVHVASERDPAFGGAGLPSLLLTRTQAVTANCGRAIQPGWLGDVATSTDSVGRCVQDNNLAEMLADPADLIRSPVPQLASGERAARAVRLLEQGRASPLPPPMEGGGAGLQGGTSAGLNPLTNTGASGATQAVTGGAGAAQGLLGPLPTAGSAAP